MFRFLTFISIPHKSITVQHIYLRVIVEREYDCWVNKCFICGHMMKEW